MRPVGGVPVNFGDRNGQAYRDGVDEEKKPESKLVSATTLTAGPFSDFSPSNSELSTKFVVKIIHHEKPFQGLYSHYATPILWEKYSTFLPNIGRLSGVLVPMCMYIADQGGVKFVKTSFRFIANQV